MGDIAAQACEAVRVIKRSRAANLRCLCVRSLLHGRGAVSSKVICATRTPAAVCKRHRGVTSHDGVQAGLEPAYHCAIGQPRLYGLM